MLHLQRLGIDLLNLALVLDIDEHHALAVANRELGLAIESNGMRRASCRVYDGRVFAAPIEGKHSVVDRLVHDAIRVGAGLNCAQHLKRFQVEYQDCIVAARTDIAAIQFRSERDSMDAVSPEFYR